MDNTVDRLAPVLLIFLLSAMICEGTQYTVGDGNGWALGFDYQKWASGQHFFAGDSLMFNYGGNEQTHDVTVVVGSAVEGCVKSPNTGVYGSGSDELFLSAAGELGFICGVDDHCKNGMKLKITTKSVVSQGVSVSPAAAPSSAQKIMHFSGLGGTFDMSLPTLFCF